MQEKSFNIPSYGGWFVDYMTEYIRYINWQQNNLYSKFISYIKNQI